MDADNNIYTDLAYQMLILHRNMNISLTKLGLTRTQMHILSYLSRHDVVKASELADAVGISYSSVTWHCNELEKQALLTRSQSATDRRNVHIRLTDTGKAKLRDIREHRKQQLLKLFANFDEAEVHTFMTLISKVNRFAHEMWDEEARTGLPPR
ncbi:MarR family winged helix-turn-helix transcriptional regulator [Alicyclobacillus contaminans]|uniref:MarR family winged helix-turn-helix transcriptional regulator n=1 Tax=Alicyclobacillus contaminans TaxID=392016 RepID=UPI000421FE83|nr:MarR family transcriptional regulator [Alicyclobacillus contaminans]